MRSTMRADLTAAVKARDTAAIAALRSALAAIENAEAVPVDLAAGPPTGTAHVVGASGVGAAEADRRDLTDADVRALVENEVRERTAAAQEYDRLGRTDQADRLRAEAGVLGRYLARCGAEN